MKSIITISREFGSGGREIGKTLADKLGIDFYDKELLELASKQSGITQELFVKHDENYTNSFLYSLVMGNYPVTPDGRIIPEEITLEDGRSYHIDKITDVRRAASLKAGGAGIRYTCRITGRDCYIFYEENNRWFVEMKVS